MALVKEWTQERMRDGMDFMDISRMRITVREFDSRPVEVDKVERILEAGRWAPTAVNGQPQRILVLDTPENLGKVREFCTIGEGQDKGSEDRGNGKNTSYYGPPLVLFVCYDTTVCWKHPQTGERSGVTDVTIVTTHMMLEAASLGMGTVWISCFDEGKAKRLLDIPEHWQPVCMLYIGYPPKDSKPASNMAGRRHPIEKTCFYNRLPEREYNPDENGSGKELSHA